MSVFNRPGGCFTDAWPFSRSLFLALSLSLSFFFSLSLSFSSLSLSLCVCSLFRSALGVSTLPLHIACVPACRVFAIKNEITGRFNVDSAVESLKYSIVENVDRLSEGKFQKIEPKKKLFATRFATVFYMLQRVFFRHGVLHVSTGSRQYGPPLA